MGPIHTKVIDRQASPLPARSRAMASLRFSVEVGPLVDGDLIALRWRVQGEQGTAKVSFTGTDILRVADWRIVEYWVNGDTALMMAQIQA